MMGLLGLIVSAWAGSAEEAQLAELDRLRGQFANQIHLAAYDLIDEMVYGWTQDPVFPTDTPVVLASVTVPVGLGTGLQALIENHTASVISANPATHVQLVHCPTCTQVLVHSGPQATVISRGIDNPDVWSQLAQSTNQHALFVDIEAEGTWLVLRARLTLLDPDLPIVWSRTLSTSADTPALLRSPDKLKSAAATREEYVDALKSKSPFAFPLRLGLRAYAQGNDVVTVPPPPFLWIQTGVEISPTTARTWTTNFLVGATFIPQAYQGFMAQGRLQRLITGRARSLTRPDLYLFLGGALVAVSGPGVAPFTNDQLDADQVIRLNNADTPQATFGTLQVGLDLRVGSRIGISGFYEWLPQYRNSPNMGFYVKVGPFNFQSFGTEVSFWF